MKLPDNFRENITCILFEKINEEFRHESYTCFCFFLFFILSGTLPYFMDYTHKMDLHLTVRVEPMIRCFFQKF